MLGLILMIVAGLLGYRDEPRYKAWILLGVGRSA